MIHYINNKPHKNIKLNKTKQHAVAAYRTKQRRKAVATFTRDLAIMLAITTLLALVALAVTN